MDPSRLTRCQRILDMALSKPVDESTGSLAPLELENFIGDNRQVDTFENQLQEALEKEFILEESENSPSHIPEMEVEVGPPASESQTLIIQTLKPMTLEGFQNFEQELEVSGPPENHLYYYTGEVDEKMNQQENENTATVVIELEKEQHSSEELLEMEIGDNDAVARKDDNVSVRIMTEEIMQEEEVSVMSENNVHTVEVEENKNEKENKITDTATALEIEKNLREESDCDYLPLSENRANKIKRNVKRKKNKVSRKEQAKINARIKHPLREPCGDSCSKRCKKLISENQRIIIYENYWSLSWLEQRNFILNSCSRIAVKRRTTGGPSQRNASFIFRLKQENGNQVAVCKTFFLTTLGYHKKNDKVVFNVLHKSALGAITVKKDERGAKPPTNKIDRETVLKHVDTFHPNISHYRREHAPRVRYLPSDVTITFMHKDFLEKFPQNNCCYEAYRKVLFQENIRFTKLGHEECEVCEIMDIHNLDHGKQKPDPECSHCQKWIKHIEKANIARKLYRRHADIGHDMNTVCVSADLEKVIMLPRMETFKKVLFTPRIIAYNETFVPVGKSVNRKILPVAFLWHEAIRGRGKEEIISTFFQFFLQNRDAEKFIFWLDNCAAQNKNWAFMSFLVYVVNSTKIAAKSVEIFYFEPGHTFMSADSVHHQIELSLRRQKKTCDFNDFVSAVENANNKKIAVKVMNASDFYNFKDFSAPNKRNSRGNEKVLLSDVVYVKTTRGLFTLEYKSSFLDEQTKTLHFLKNDVYKKRVFPEPVCHSEPCGVSEERKSSIIKNLLDLMEENRKDFWTNLPVKK